MITRMLMCHSLLFVKIRIWCNTVKFIMESVGMKIPGLLHRWCHYLMEREYLYVIGFIFTTTKGVILSFFKQVHLLRILLHIYNTCVTYVDFKSPVNYLLKEVAWLGTLIPHSLSMNQINIRAVLPCCKGNSGTQ